MKTVVCALYDKKAQVFKTPFYLPRLEMAARSLSGAVNSPEKNDLSEYPEDFALYHLATYDDETGNFRNETPPVFVAEAKQFKKPLELHTVSVDKSLDHVKQHYGVMQNTITPKGEK